MTQRILIFSENKTFNKIINELLVDLRIFELNFFNTFSSDKKINGDDIPILFCSEKDSLSGFQDFLKNQVFKNTYIVFNSKKEEKSEDNSGALFLNIPFSFNELFQALNNAIAQRARTKYHDIKFKKLSLNMAGRTIGNSKTSTKFTDKEVKILWHLLNDRGEKVSQRFLLNEVWGYSEDIETKTLTTHIYTIRKKINHLSNLFSIESSEEGYYIKFK